MDDFFDIQDAPYAVETAFSSEPERFITFEEYIESEKLSAEKHEFHNGKLYTMAGGTDTHNRICGRIIITIGNILDEKEDVMYLYTSDMNVRINSANKGLYPDVTVLDGVPNYYLGSRRVILNPSLIVEVLSDSTEKYDRGLKFDHYKTLDSFREYVLVAQDSPSIEVHFLENPKENVWKVTKYEGLDKVVTLDSIGCTVKMSQIYYRVFK